MVRHAERVPLGTTYPEVVERVRALLTVPEIEGQCELVVDATGVGAPVVDLLRLAGLRPGVFIFAIQMCGDKAWPSHLRSSRDISSVTITGGEKETARPGYGGGHYNVPKRDLIASVQLLRPGNLIFASECLGDKA